MQTGLFQSTLPIREETAAQIEKTRSKADFNPLFPYGKRHGRRRRSSRWPKFQSTLPIREETADRRGAGGASKNFNPLFPYGKRHRGHPPSAGGGISIHSSHTGRDLAGHAKASAVGAFQSTLPIREETGAEAAEQGHGAISIHSSHTGRDSKRIQPFCTKSCSICTT